MEGHPRSKSPVERLTSLNVATPKALAYEPRKRIRVLIVHECVIVQDALRKLIETQADFVVVGNITATEAVRSIHELMPDVVLLDVPKASLSRGDELRRVRDTCLSVRTILLTSPIDGSALVKLLQLGARGVIGNDCPVSLLYKSIRCVFRDELWISRESMLAVVRALSNTRCSRKPPKYGLTARELEILAWVVKGYVNKDIARVLSIREDTVKHHLTNIFDKTGVSQRLELALFAIRNRLVEESAENLVESIGER